MNSISEIIPEGSNIKLIFRHSKRPSLKGEPHPDSVSLSEEGKSLAREFGRNLDYPLGGLYSSHILRCQQTLECILEGKGEAGKEIIISREVLGSVFFTDKTLAEEFFRVRGVKKSIKSIIDNEPLTGLKPLQDCVNEILDYLFNTGNKPGTVDLYCTHDLHIALLYAALFRETDTHEEIVSNWAEMLEGMVLWGCRTDFYCLWRDRLKHITQRDGRIA